MLDLQKINAFIAFNFERWLVLSGQISNLAFIFIEKKQINIKKTTLSSGFYSIK